MPTPVYKKKKTEVIDSLSSRETEWPKFFPESYESEKAAIVAAGESIGVGQ